MGFWRLVVRIGRAEMGTNLGGCWFTDRVVSDWNRLGRRVVGGESIGSFKRRLDQSMDRDDRWDGEILEIRNCLM